MLNVNNGPMEGFGDLKESDTMENDLPIEIAPRKMIEDYIDYYNNKRLQKEFEF